MTLAIPVADVSRIEFATRISDDVAKIEASASAEVLEVRKEDVIHTTNDMKIKGQIENVIINTDSSALGAVQLKLADVRTLRSLAFVEQITNSIGMKLVSIPAGKFLMGSPKDEKGRVADEEQHEVEITKPFHMGVYTVTVGQFRQFVKDSGYQTETEKDGEGGVGYNAGIKTYEGLKPHFNWKNTGFEQTDEHPVVNVTWNDAVAFCAWLSKKEGKTYRLPTEAEWEYSCRAGTKTRFYSGDSEESLAGVANYSGSKIGMPTPVGQFKPNAFGLYDMHGNVWQWCGDWYGEDYYKKSPGQDPQGPSAGAFRVFRGGSFTDGPWRWCRSASRWGRERLRPANATTVFASCSCGSLSAESCALELPTPGSQQRSHRMQQGQLSHALVITIPSLAH